MASSQFSASSDPHNHGQVQQGVGAARPFLGIQYKCCQTYGRLYRTTSGTSYEGRCPKCGKLLSVPIGSGGTGQRFFSAG